MASERVERRLTAILAADIAGYSRLMGADEEGTLAQLKAHRRELGRQLLQRLQAHYPGAHADGQLRTLQRRLKAWRAEMARGLILGIPANSAGDRSASSAPAYPDTEQAAIVLAAVKDEPFAWPQERPSLTAAARAGD